MAGDARTMLKDHLEQLLEEVPALKPLTLVVGVDLEGRGDVQQFRIEFPAVTVTKDLHADSKVRVECRRDFFNAMVENGAKIADWHDAYRDGRFKATGVQQYLQLIGRVIAKQEERTRLERRTKGLRGH